MAVLEAAAASAVLGGLFQAYNAAESRGANKVELDKMAARFNALVPPKYDMSITDPPELIQEKLSSPQFAQAIQSPDFDMSKFTPEDYKLVGKYSPESAAYIKETAPTLIKSSADMQTGRAAQLAALKKFTDVGSGSFDPEYQQKVMESKLGAQAEAQSRQNSILQDYARRGQSGSGLNLAAQLGGASQAMNTNAMQGLQAASDAYRNRLNALAQGAQLGGQISQQDQAMQGQNAGIINDFNQRMSASQNQYEQNRANMMNSAQLQNLLQSQNIANQNTQGRNQAALTDRQRQDELAKYGYSTALANQGRDDDLQKYGYQNAANERNYQNAIATQLANWQQAQKDTQNNLFGKAYGDKLNQASGASGIGMQQGQNAIQTAQDQNAAIQGISNLGMTYGMYQDKKDNPAAAAAPAPVVAPAAVPAVKAPVALNNDDDDDEG